MKKLKKINLVIAMVLFTTMYFFPQEYVNLGAWIGNKIGEFYSAHIMNVLGD